MVSGFRPVWRRFRHGRQGSPGQDDGLAGGVIDQGPHLRSGQFHDRRDLADIRHRIARAGSLTARRPKSTTLVAVTGLNFPVEEIRPVIEAGQRLQREPGSEGGGEIARTAARAETDGIELHHRAAFRNPNKAAEAGSASST